MTIAVKFGTVVGWVKWEFPNGIKADKYLIILGAKASMNLLAVLVTSQPHGRQPNPGCHAKEGYFFIKGGGPEKFPKDTWVVINDPQIINRTDLESKLREIMSKRVVWPEWDLPTQIVAAIRNCLKQSDDVSAAHLALCE